MISELKENQENLCKLPKITPNFVGREKEIEDAQKQLLEGNKFVIITGGPCYGKSTMAIEVGHALFNNPYNYVIWISMRELPSSPPTLENVAQAILKKFEIDTSEIEEKIVDILIRKFKSITSGGETALLIFDNADDLIIAHRDTLCQQSTYAKLSSIIRGNSIHAIFTTRVCSISDSDKDHHKIKLVELLENESQTFVDKELKVEMKGLDREQIVKDLVSVSHGFPFALRLISSRINRMDSNKMIGDYVNELKQGVLETVCEDSPLLSLFALSLKQLDKKEEKLLSLLAVFPSRFAYAYVQKLIDVLEDDTIKAGLLRELEKHSVIQDDSHVNKKAGLLRELEKHSVIQDDSHVNKANQSESSSEECFLIHPFLCQYIRQVNLDAGIGHIYERSFYTLYIRQLFILSRNALEKDNYVNCWEEFQTEQHNFFHVMVQIGKGLVDQSSDLKKTLCKELNRKEAPDYIATYLFCVDMINTSLLLEFFEGCKELVNEELKKDIWCCIYDLNMKCYEKGNVDPYKHLAPGKYGQSTLGQANYI